MLWNKTNHTDCGVYLYYINANILCLISELAVGKANDFNSDKDILVLPLDTTKFETHEDAFKTVLDHFSQVLYKQSLFFHYTGCIKKKVIELWSALAHPLYNLQKSLFRSRKDQAFSFRLLPCL